MIADVGQANAVLEQLRSESDRGAALVGLAYLDELLEKLVQARMIEDEKHLNKLLQSPLFTSNARADLAYALGWLGPQIFGDLSTLRKIRNKFAHSYEGLHFEDAEIGQLCRNLKVVGFVAGYRLRRNRDRFLVSVGFLWLQLTELCCGSSHPPRGTDPPIKHQSKQ